MSIGPLIPEIQHFQNLTLKIQGQGHGWEKTLKVTTWGQHSIDSHRFHSMSISYPVPDIRLYKKLTLKIQGQGHGWSQSCKSQSVCNILSTHIPFVPCQLALPFLRLSIFKIWLWKSKVKVMGEVDIESHMGRRFCRLISLSFHVNPPSHSWDTTFSKFDFENPKSRSWVRGTLKVTKWVWHRFDSHPFRSMSIGPSIPKIQHFQNLTLKIQGQGQMTMMLHNYRSRQFHRASNGINSSSGFRDMGFWPMGKPIWANDYDSAQLQA